MRELVINLHFARYSCILSRNILSLKARESGASIGIPFDLCTCGFWPLHICCGITMGIKNIRTFKHTLYSYTRASVGGRCRYLAYPSWLLGLKCYWAMLLGYEGFHWPVSLNEGSGRSYRKTWRRVQGREVQRRSRIYFCLFWQMIQFLVIAGETRSFSIWYIKWSTRSKFTYLQNMNFIYINSFVQVRRWLTRYRPIGRERPWILFPCNPRNYLNF